MSAEKNISNYIEQRIDKKSMAYALIYNSVTFPITKERLRLDNKKFNSEEEEEREILKAIIFRLKHFIGDLDYALTLFAKSIDLKVEKNGEEEFISCFLKDMNK